MSEFTNAIKAGEFQKAEFIATDLTPKTIEDELFNLSYDEESVAPYGFVCFMLTKKETSEWHYLASLLLSMAINHLEGAYFTAFHHAKRAADLSPDNISYKEALLFYYEIPDQPLSKEEAEKIAADILKIAPKNQAANRVFNPL